MNSLSLVLYGISVVSDFHFLILFFSIISFIIMIIITFTIFDGDIDKKYLHGWFIVLFLTILLVVIPNKTTMYAIAASEMGEEITTSETGKKAQQGVLDWINSQTKHCVYKD